MNKKKSVILVIVLWIIITAISVIKSEITLHYGKEVLLETVPVDPRDFLKGDYVILNYKIRELPLMKKYEKLKNNETVYVMLHLNDKNVANITDIRRQEPDYGLYLKGRITGCRNEIPFFKSGRCIEYGIESYYVKEHTGKELENKLADGALVRVAILRGGSAKVKGFVEQK